MLLARGPDRDFNVLAEGGEEGHQALDGEMAERLRISSDTCGWAMPMTSPACAWVNLRALMMR